MQNKQLSSNLKLLEKMDGMQKSLEEIKNITSFDAILYSAKGKHLTGTVEEPEHSDIFVKEFIVSEEDVREKNDAIAFAVEIDSELEYVLVMFCQYTSENLVIGRWQFVSFVHLCLVSQSDMTEIILFRIFFLAICLVLI